jgi:chorismate mutase
MPVRGIRGATTSDDNTRESILEATKEMLAKLVQSNGIEVDHIAAAHFTTTSDLNAEFPAVAARQMGWVYVALMCSHEMSVPGAAEKCIRVMLMVNTEKVPKDLRFVYLKGAKNLRERGIDKV